MVGSSASASTRPRWESARRRWWTENRVYFVTSDFKVACLDARGQATKRTAGKARVRLVLRHVGPPESLSL